MANGGYPTVQTLAPPAPARVGKALRPPLPGVQRTGPSPFLDYPIADWPHVTRRKGAKVPLVKAAPFAKVAKRAQKFGKYLPLARAAGRAINRYQDLLETAETVASMMKPINKNARWVNPSGWTLCNAYSACTIAPAFVSLHNGSCGGVGPTCLALQAFNAANMYGIGTVTNVNDATTHIIYKSALTNSGTRTTHVRSYARGVGLGVQAIPTYEPRMLVGVEPAPGLGIQTTLDPELLPMLQPVADPVPIPYGLQPYRIPNRGRDPMQQHEVGYGTTLEEGLAFGLDPSTDAPSSPPPEIAVEVVPGVGVTPLPPGAVRPHTATRPRKDEKEKKLILSAVGKVAFVANIITEGADFVDSLHKGLPAKYRAKRVAQVDPITGRKYTSQPSPYAKAQAIWQNLEHMRWEKALVAWINNAAEDKFFGKLGRVAAKGNRNVYNKTGLRGQFGLGPAI